MEQEYKFSKGKQALKISLTILIFLALCVLCAFAGYFFARSKSPLKETIPEDSALNEYHLPEKSETPFHLPTMHAEEDVTIPPSFSPTESREYFVIAENDAVRLYRLMQNGKKEFQKNLDISLSALTEEDRLALIKGRILKSEDELSSLLEDYTS